MSPVFRWEFVTVHVTNDAKQAAQLEKQAARIAELELQLAKALKDSSTSSKPPSRGDTGTLNFFRWFAWPPQV